MILISTFRWGKESESRTQSGRGENVCLYFILGLCEVLSSANLLLLNIKQANKSNLQ